LIRSIGTATNTRPKKQLESGSEPRFSVWRKSDWLLNGTEASIGPQAAKQSKEVLYIRAYTQSVRTLRVRLPFIGRAVAGFSDFGPMEFLQLCMSRLLIRQLESTV
jgi:hypothetical protein